jgi:PIN domain nuclease of toxin-antitoxin system
LKLLLDTHYCLWLTFRRDRLQVQELSAIIEPDNEIAFSSVSIWELQIKWESRYVSGERKGEVSPIDVLYGLRQIEFLEINLTSDLAAATLQQQLAHSDPFDSLLLTIAQETGRKLLTRDTRLRGHPLAYHAD